MSDIALEDVESAMRFARMRGALLAQDVANARTPGFVAKDASLIPAPTEEGDRFFAVLHDLTVTGPSGVLEYAMGAQARNAVAYHELAQQERAMLRELRSVAEQSER
jgi:hypothetical protein